MSQTKEALKLVGQLKFYDNTLPELQKGEKNFRYFSKNWYKHTKDR